MKRLKLYILLVSLVAVLSSCHKDDYVSIDSLSKLGDSFYSNQQVPVWVCVSAHDYDEMEYKWECSGGSFYGPTDVVRAVWVAPTTRGEYEVKCTVTCGRESQTRTTTMNVTDFFIDEFGSDSSDGYTTSNLTTTWNSLNYEMGLSVDASKSGTLTRSFSDDAFNYPFTFNADFAWRSSYKDQEPFTMTMLFNRPDDNRTTYLRSVYFTFLPTATSTDRDSSTGYYLKNVQVYAEMWNVTYNRSTIITLVNEFREDMKFANGSYTVDSRGMRNLKMDIYEDFTVVGTADTSDTDDTPIEFCNSTALKEYMEGIGMTQVLNLKQIIFAVEGECEVYLDNIHVNQMD